MAVTYNKLWKLLIDKDMNKTDLKEASGVSFNVMARMGKNETISFESIEKICFALQCNIGDIIDVIYDEPASIKTPKSIELFAGAGGLALGIEKAGFDTLGLIEIDKDASDTLKTNRPKWRVINDDISNISGQDLTRYFGIKKDELDLLSGGAPCQSYPEKKNIPKNRKEAHRNGKRFREIRDKICGLFQAGKNSEHFVIIFPDCLRN